ncbi:hypothetical protein BUALT_Bualt17G0068700 [Buddleja alternifolia]|uniref:MATH domain-containing protein n=1 Tax=Buddleja alternifolia TaxID=168488 RepID=A0AAV6WED0_9LAMI|nr:hypothetical protein BUALT_Bualt17G0068700 [Buddleja alternifolia]
MEDIPKRGTNGSGQFNNRRMLAFHPSFSFRAYPKENPVLLGREYLNWLFTVPVILDFLEKGVLVETREVYPSHFLFKIESFSLLSDNGIDKYETTDFVAGDYKWRLIIYPDRRDSENKGDHVSVYLAMANTSSLPATWEVNAVFSIFLLNQKLDNFLSVRGRARRFHALHPEWGFSKFISKKSLTDPSNGYLVDDKCVFGAEVFVIKSQGTIECLSILNAEVPYKHSFNISNFSKLEDVWSSDNFILGDQTWSIQVYPRGNGKGKGRNVSIYLHLVDSKPASYCKLKVKYTIGIKNQYTDENHILSCCTWLTPPANWGWYSFMPIKDMNDPKKGFVVGDCCIVEVEILLQAIAQIS